MSLFKNNYKFFMYVESEIGESDNSTRVPLVSMSSHENNFPPSNKMSLYQSNCQNFSRFLIDEIHQFDKIFNYYNLKLKVKMLFHFKN